MLLGPHPKHIIGIIILWVGMTRNNNSNIIGRFSNKWDSHWATIIWENHQSLWEATSIYNNNKLTNLTIIRWAGVLGPLVLHRELVKVTWYLILILASWRGLSLLSSRSSSKSPLNNTELQQPHYSSSKANNSRTIQKVPLSSIVIQPSIKLTTKSTSNTNNNTSISSNLKKGKPRRPPWRKSNSSTMSTWSSITLTLPPIQMTTTYFMTIPISSNIMTSAGLRNSTWSSMGWARTSCVSYW